MRPPPPSPLSETCNGNVSICPNNQPQYYTSSRGESEANIAIVFFILLFALICDVALNIAFRCSLCLRRRLDEIENQKLDIEVATCKHKIQQQPTSPPTISSVRTRLVRDEVECAICLAQFVEGDEIKVLSKCKHEFHVNCIHRWLSFRSSCPTCRASYLPSPSLTDKERCTVNPISATDGPNWLFESSSFFL